MWPTLVAAVATIGLLAFLAAFFRATIVKADDWNDPGRARSVGIGCLGMLLAGAGELLASEGGMWPSVLTFGGMLLMVAGVAWFFFGPDPA
ncbi:MAG: hypothetical protein AB7K24_07290 [Gemmataceae bacterium]